jgi:heme/copper-type cytochrome/quinol oxidase subunit 3
MAAQSLSSVPPHDQPAASHPLDPKIECESPTAHPRSIWVSARLLSGAITFFFGAFVFAYFYLQALDVNHRWRIGPVHPSQGLGLAIAALYLVGAIDYRLSVKRSGLDELTAGILAVLMGLAAVALQFLEYTTLDFGAASGGYAAVFYGWTALYAIVALLGIYWIETQVATLWRMRRPDGPRQVLMPQDEETLLRAQVEASSFYWAYFAAIGVLAYFLLYFI